MSIHALCISPATKDDNYSILGLADHPFHLAAVSFLKATNYLIVSRRMMRIALY